MRRTSLILGGSLLPAVPRESAKLSQGGKKHILTVNAVKRWNWLSTM